MLVLRIETMPVYNINNCIVVPKSQSEVAVMQTYDNQPRQDDERKLRNVENNDGAYMCTQVLLKL